MTNYALHGKLEAVDGKGAMLAEILLEAAKLLSKASGCKLYLISKEQEVPDSIWVTEVWNSKADHDNSLSNPAVRALIAKAIPLLAEQPLKGQELEVIGGLGV